MAIRLRRSEELRGYLVAFAATAVAALLRLVLLRVVSEQAPFFPFMLAVLFAAWYGGLLPGLVATALGAVLGSYLSVPPYSLSVTVYSGAFVSVVFFLIGATASWLCGALHAARHRAEGKQRELEQAEERIRKDHEILQLVHKAGKIGHWEWNSLTDENKWSPEIEALYGLPPGGFGGGYGGWTKLLHPDDLAKAEADVKRALETGEYFTEFRVVWPDGSVHWLETRAKVFKDGHDKPVRLVGVNMDVTERKRVEEELRKSQEELHQRVGQMAEADRHKNEFLALLGHELRNPLAPLRNGLSILRLQSSADPTVARLAPIMERQLATLVRLVDDLLDVSRISRGKVELRKEAVDLTAQVARAVEAARPALDERRHGLEVELPPEPVWVEADPARVEQVLSNLLSNAARYTPPGGRVRLSVTREGAEGVVRVRDTGIGIRPEAMPFIWEMFRQADRVAGHVSEGLGIGLTLVRRLVELHGGTAAAVSDGPGKGSEFTIRLPALSQSAPAAARPA